MVVEFEGLTEKGADVRELTKLTPAKALVRMRERSRIMEPFTEGDVKAKL